MTALIEAYRRIQMTPYKIVDIEFSLDNSLALIDSRGASCTPKHIVLDNMIKKLGFETKFCVHEFKWSTFNLQLPKEIYNLINPRQIDFHTNLEVKINNNWIIVDATWDDNLIDIGFPGTKKWDGITSTINGVTSLNEYKFNSLEDRNSFLKSRNNKLDNESEFINQLNKYLEKIRTLGDIRTSSFVNRNQKI
jgi:hypothetical protein